MQTLLDTNFQLDPHTRHAQGLPVHYGFLTIKYTAVWVVEGRLQVEVLEWRRLSLVYVQLAPPLMMMWDMFRWVVDISLKVNGALSIPQR